MTDPEFARALGEQLRLLRMHARLSPRDVHRRGGPTHPTIEAIEAGRIGTWARLLHYTRALGTTLDDCVRNAQRTEPLSADVIELLRLYAAAPPRARRLVADLLELSIVASQKTRPS